MKPVRKAVIPAAGLGTRFLPATKTVPKELLPIVDRPIILYIVEEAINAGIEDIVLIAGRNKHSIEDFFDVSYELQDILEKKKQSALLEKIQDLHKKANFISIRQKQALGLGHAVHCAKPVVGDEPFAVLLGDEIMIGKGKKTVIGELVNAYEKTEVSCVTIMKVDTQDVAKYGIIKGQEISKGTWKIEDVVEKPNPNKAPSTWALPGRYVFTNGIIDALENLSPTKNGEIQLTDGMVKLAKKEGMNGIVLNAARYDAGDKLGYLQANVEVGLNHPELKDSFRKYLKDLVKQF
ncbi:MAG: UTP--glucose-1-phosphate uridylyltransferase [Proteobacteria bacterium SG_bin7]|nr:MAG: UTP--glucose-1-phosphate uridylyltransferase [Proteobacteria bacterium SG_bin7]